MSDQDTVYLKVTISREVSRRFKVYVANKYPDLLRGPLSEEVEKALVQYLDGKEKGLQHTHTHTQTAEIQQQQFVSLEKPGDEMQQITKNKKYQALIETIKRFSNSQRQITSGLAKRAIMEVIGKDQRTIDKYLKILQEDSILYGDSLTGKYDIQSWVFGDYNTISLKKEEVKQTTIVNNNSWSQI